MKIAIGCDHAGFRLKDYLLKELTKLGHEMINCGTDSEDSVDYPDYAGDVCRLIQSNNAQLGILVCSTGIGISIAANKLKGIRAALCHTEFSAAMARQHNDANVLTLGGAVIGNKLALSISMAFLKEDFTPNERHIRRIRKISDSEK
ncbi:MAG: ribose 5-phosphate isomerase B [Candidatus Latescibacteria bacterium]|jgi:ribose 5-phosphate isomerase B|nr:ribose 5-phosphate isomerase B [Candidatus Latescibacterota bacterium]